ncbi:MAG: TonB-dependent receptor, partial [Candidatus Kapabacteria bacterium]|nr:TonB-dependent receptor [Candidatus Kapabacteria bacterium]
IDYKDGAQLNGTETPETEILTGSGRAYGLEVLLKKKSGRLTGWLSYTVARTERMINGVNNNEWYPFRQDRTHDISVVAMYQYSDTWSFSANFVYYTGNAVTFPSGKYEVAGNVVFYYTERNGYRMPAYNRLDLGATWKIGERSELNFSLYNAYGQQNAYTIDFRTSESDPTKTEAVQTSLFRWIPSVTWNFKF